MRAFLLLLFFTGVVLVVTNELVKAHARPPRVEYRYLPRDLDTYLREQPVASVQFRGMFRDEDLALVPRGGGGSGSTDWATTVSPSAPALSAFNAPARTWPGSQ